MKLQTVFAAVLALAGAASASAVTLTNYGAYTLSYNELTSFTFTDLSFSGGGGSTGFGWNVDTSVSVTSFGAVTTAVFTLPNFTISVNPGWVLSGPVAGFLGNLVFNEVGAGAATSAATSGMVSVDGGPALPFGGALTKVATTVLPGYTGGYYVGNASAGIGSFSSFSFSGGTLTLSAGGGAFSSIIGQSQNELSVGLIANPVPEPETAALLLAGLLTLGSLARRRSRS